MKVVSEAIKEARLKNNLTQEELGQMGYISLKTVSAIECGRRNIAPDVLGEITRKLDNPRLYMEAADEITGGVFGVPWLNGENVDLHRASVKEKVVEELEEAISAISNIKVMNNPKACKEEQLNKIYKSIEEVIDVYVAAAHYVAVMCDEYGFNIKSLFQEQRRKLIKNGYLRADNTLNNVHI